MEVSTTWTEKTYIKSSETDFQKRLKLSGFFQLMQDIASNHANHLGVGYEALQQRELAWVLSRKKVRFIDFPRMGETITMRTWPKGIQQKIFFMRDHEMTGDDGRALAVATSAYVLVSTRARRIVLPNALEMDLPSNNGLSALDETLEKLPTPDEALQDCCTLPVGYSAVDVMGHVNNARYIEWIADCYSLEEHRANRPHWLQINYLNEVLPGERVILQRARRTGSLRVWYIAGMNATTGAKAFEAEMGWEPIL
jgi:acyl-ACP thioesterase